MVETYTEKQELLNKFFPLFLITNNDGIVTQVSEIFGQISESIAVGQKLHHFLGFSKYESLITHAEQTNGKGPFHLKLNDDGLTLRLLQYPVAGDDTVWVANIIPDQAVKLNELPADFKKFPQYDELLEQMVTINTARLSIDDALEMQNQLVTRTQKFNWSENQYKRVVDLVNDVVFEADNSGNWTFLNPSWCRILEYTVEESLNKPFFSFLHPDDVKKNEALFIPLINREKSYCSHQTRYISKSGVVKYIKVYATLNIDVEGNVRGTTGTLQDISLQVQQEKNYKLLTENIQEMVVLHQPDGGYSFISQSVSVLLGYQPEELVGTHPSQLMHPEDYEKVVQAFLDFTADPQSSLVVTYRIRNKRGNYVWMEAVISLLNDEWEEVSGYISSARIIEERKRAEKFMVQALENQREMNEQKSKIISLVSHEFRNPISSIQITSDVIKTYINRQLTIKPVDLERHVKRIDAEVRRLKDSLDNILMIGKIESGNITATKKEISLQEIVKDVVERIKDVLYDDRKPEIEITGKVRAVNADAMQLTCIIENMVSNAYKYSAGKRAPVIRIDYASNSFVIVVRDFGIGIPEAEQNKLFSAFYRATNTGSIAGTGLGLVVIKKFVAMHGGLVKIESSEGKGTQIMVKIKS